MKNTRRRGPGLRLGGFGLALLGVFCALAPLSCKGAGSGGASSDASLASLSILARGSALALSPAFSPSTGTYSTGVAANVASVTVEAKATDSAAAAEGLGARNLAIGANLVTVKVTAADASTTRTYTVAITRAASHVYIDGGVWAAGDYNHQVPVFWKDGVMAYLPLDSGYSSGGLGGIAVDDKGTVYVAGNQDGTQGGYWKNSVFVALSSGPYSNALPSDIAVDTAGNVWALGSASSGSGSVFVYWKNNGVPTALPGSPASAGTIQADMQGNVFIVGTVGTGSAALPCVWENGSTQIYLALSGGNTGGYPHKLAMDGAGDLYSCGNQWGGPSAGPAIWRRASGSWQAAAPLSMAGYDLANPNGLLCMAFDSSGRGSCIGQYDLPAASAYYNTLLYWANPASEPSPMTLPSGTSALLVTDSAAAYDADDHFIVVGSAGTNQPSGRGSWPIADGVPIYWEDGSPHPLATDATRPFGWARSMAVGP